ncbi:MAG: hypothetical protein Q4D38_00090 [Planctomycetia bacterium]|nr:hypothetical protein [Planctomycetia bacterium]
MQHYRYKHLEMAARNGGIAVADVNKDEDLNSVRLIPVPEWVRRIDDFTSMTNTFKSHKDTFTKEFCQNLDNWLEVMHKVLKDAINQGDPTNPKVLAELSDEFKRSHKSCNGVGKGLILK